MTYHQLLQKLSTNRQKLSTNRQFDMLMGAARNIAIPYNGNPYVHIFVTGFPQRKSRYTNYFNDGFSAAEKPLYKYTYSLCVYFSNGFSASEKHARRQQVFRRRLSTRYIDYRYRQGLRVITFLLHLDSLERARVTSLGFLLYTAITY